MVERNRALLVALCLATLLGGFWLYTRANTIPYYFHSDEPSKVTQVMGERGLNFKHPLLLMNGTRLGAWLVEAGDRQEAVMVGRTLSALFGALSAALLVALAGVQRGLLAALCAAPILVLEHGLFTFAHFMKEDTALMLGVSASLLAVTWVLRSRSDAALLGLGVGCALATSGKYIGAVLVPGALLVLLTSMGGDRPPSRGRALALFGLAFAATMAVINVTIFLEFDRFRAGLAYETGHATTGGGKPFDALFSRKYFYGMLGLTTWPVRILAAGWFVHVLASWRERSADERIVALFPALYLALLWVSPIKAIRYLLPVVVTCHLLAALGLAAVLDRITQGTRSGWRRVAIVAVALAAVLWPQVQRIRTHVEEFRGDSRLVLYSYVRDELPANAAILQDRYAGLPDARMGYPSEAYPALPQTLHTEHFASDYGSVAEIRAAGFGYVAVSGRAYERFLGETPRFGSDEVREEYERRRDGYLALFEDGELIFEDGTALVLGAPVNPVTRLYRVR